jgi:aspartate/methionine/tyrosine aminotransferase
VFGCRAELDGHVGRYRTNRDLLIGLLGAAGLTRFAPAEGAFYLYVNISSLTLDSEEFCRQLLTQTGVAVTPGLDFDPVNGGAWVRFSFAGSTESVTEAAHRLRHWLGEKRQND